MNFDILISEPLKEMVMRVVSFIPTLFLSLFILIVGWILTKFVRDTLTHLLSKVGFDKLSDKLGLTHVLKTGGLRHKPSELVGCIFYWVFMAMFLMIAVKAIGLTVASTLVDTILGYIPSVISGVIVLTIGMLIARIVSAVVYVTAKNTDMPAAVTLSKLSKIAIMIYVTVLYLKEIGLVTLFEGTHYTMFIGGIIFALALAFGLAGKDLAHKYIDVFNVKKAHE